MYHDWNTFDFSQGHVTKNQPMTVSVSLSESLGIWRYILFTVEEDNFIMIFNGLFILISISLFQLFNPAFPLWLNSNPSLYSSVCWVLSPVRDLLYIIDFSGQTKDILFAFLTRENLVQMRSYVSRGKTVFAHLQRRDVARVGLYFGSWMIS